MAAPETKRFEGPSFLLSIGSGVTCNQGDLLSWNNTANELTLADADSLDSYASFMALMNGDGSGQNNRVAVTRKCLLSDSDGPYTAETPQYLSPTAGAVTETRPTAAPDLVQVVGMSVDDEQVEIDIKVPYEVYVPIQVMFATSADALLDSGNFGGPTMDAQNEQTVLNFTVPENAIALQKAILWIAAEASGGTPTWDITIGSAISGAQHDVVTQDATLVNQVREGSAVDEMFALDISTGLDATDIIRPGAIVGIKGIQDDGGTDISFCFGGYAVFLCV